MAPSPDRRFPKMLTRVVAVTAIGTAVVLVSLAWNASGSSETPPSPEPVAASPGAGPEAFQGCTSCHEDLDKVFKQGRAKLLTYTHKEHFRTGVSDCAMCHVPDTHQADKITVPPMERCFMCHGRGAKAIAPGSCETCHPPGSPAQPSSHNARWDTTHGKLAKADDFPCLTCHEENFCRACHGLTMPHPQAWEATIHSDTYFGVGAQACRTCHVLTVSIGASRRDFCDSCHHQQGPESVAWRRFHPTFVKQEGATTCFQCHNPVTCATCHTNGSLDLSADEHYQPMVPAPGSPRPTSSSTTQPKEGATDDAST